MSVEVEPLSTLEQQFERWRVRTGLVLAPAAFAGVLSAEFSSLRPEAHRLAAVMAAVVVLWLTEAVAMPVAALVGASLCVVLRVAPAKDVFAPFADPIMFLFIGSFILARAIFQHGLDRRFAFWVLSLHWVGGSPTRILFAFGAVTAALSAWISNTATTAMMFAIGMSILGYLLDRDATAGQPVSRRYATGLMLMTSFAASIGGLATPVGTPPNLIGLSKIRESLGVEIPFLKWMCLGVPIVVCLFLYLFVYLNWLCPAGRGALAGERARLEAERRQLGPWTAGQRSTCLAFVLTVILWIVPGAVALYAGEASDVYHVVRDVLQEAVVALLCAALLFVLPADGGRKAITWREAAEIDWGVVLLYGGGFALGVLADKTGLAATLGKNLAALLPSTSGLGLLIAATLVATLVSELTSNTASAIIVVPVAINVAQAVGADPLEPALGATFAASLGFMLPVSTPCNAIVYGSGYIPLPRMVRYGLLLDVAGVAVIVVMVRLLSGVVR